MLGNFAHLAQALFLKAGVADREHFVDDKNFRLEMRGDGKCQSSVHAARISFHRRVDELFHFRKRHDFVEFAIDFRLVHPQQCARHEDVFAAR